MSRLGRRAFIGGAVAGLAAARLGAAPVKPAAPFTTVATGLAFPEGLCPLRGGELLFVEIAAARLSRLTTSGLVEPVAQLGGGPNGCAIGPDGKAYVTNNGGLEFRRLADGRLALAGVLADYTTGSIQRVDLSTGSAETLYTQCGDHPLRGPNDLAFDGGPGFWFTDTGKIRKRDRDQGGLYWARADGSEIREVVYPLGAPNGIALSPDRKRLLVALSDKRQVIAFDIVGPGELRSAGGVPVPQIVASPAGPFSIDNIAVEADGGLVLAAVGLGAVVGVDARGRTRVTRELGDPVVTCPAFDRRDPRMLYVALSSTGRIVRLDWPRAGVLPIFC